MDPELFALIERRRAAIDVLRAILVESLHVQAQPEAIDPDAPLFGTGLALDSVDALELVVAAEQSFEVTLPEDDLRQSLRSINTLVDLLLHLQDAEASR
jgi:acyl carrier protein